VSEEDKIASLFQTLATDTPSSVRDRARELASAFAGEGSTAAVPLAPGDVTGHYEIEGVLGSGGQAVVYAAKDAKLGKRVALKVPRKDVGDRLVREAKLLASLAHPSIVQVFALELEGRVPFLVLELCEGWSLEERLEVVAPDGLPLDQVRATATAVLEALAFAHDRGIVHRDVKPSNILFDKENHAKVSDFGIGTIARKDELSHSAELSQLSILAGTPLYVAPEQENPSLRVEGQLDGRADLFAFGKVLFQMLTGASPRTIRPASRLRPGLDAAWDEYVFKLTEERPERRFTDAREALAALPGGPLVHAKVDSGERIGPWKLEGESEHGALGTAFHAVHVTTGAPAIVRVRYPGAGKLPPSAMDEFVRAAEAASRPRANVARVLQYGVLPDGTVFVVTDDADAQPLDKLSKRGPIPWREALRIVGQAARGLAAAHGGLIHGNVTPESIVVSSRGEVKLTGFALGGELAKSQRLTSSGAVIGSPFYLSPEAAMGKALDARSDIYSLGAVFYELLTGRKPVVGEVAIAVFRAIVEGKIAPPETFVPDLPGGVRRVLGKMLATERERRYGTAVALLEDLEALMRGDEPKAEEPRLWAKTRPWLAADGVLATKGDRFLRHAPLAWTLSFVFVYGLALAGETNTILHLQPPPGMPGSGTGGGIAPGHELTAIAFAVNWLLFLPLEFATIFAGTKRYPQATAGQRLLAFVPVLALILSFFGALLSGIDFLFVTRGTPRIPSPIGQLALEIPAIYSGGLLAVLACALWRRGPRPPSVRPRAWFEVPATLTPQQAGVVGSIGLLAVALFAAAISLEKLVLFLPALLAALADAVLALVFLRQRALAKLGGGGSRVATATLERPRGHAARFAKILLAVVALGVGAKVLALLVAYVFLRR
jgi:serine/threonine protein kinase